MTQTVPKRGLPIQYAKSGIQLVKTTQGEDGQRGCTTFTYSNTVELLIWKGSVKCIHITGTLSSQSRSLSCNSKYRKHELERSEINALLLFYSKSRSSVPHSTNRFKIKRTGSSIKEMTRLVVQNVLSAPSMSGLMLMIVKLADFRQPVLFQIQTRTKE